MKKTIFMGLIIGVIATTMVSTSAIPASAEHKTPAQGGLNNADDNVHDNTGDGDAGSKQDSAFHEGTCQGGHSTTALGARGCVGIGDPGNSDENRQDDPPLREH